MPVAIEYKSDHLVLRLVGRSFLTSLRRALVIPYSDIRSVEVEAPRWPSLLSGWHVGTHLPKRVAHGLFSTWDANHKRFVHFDKETTRVLTLHLDGHPDFHEVSVEVRDPDAAQQELSKRASP